MGVKLWAQDSQLSAHPHRPQVLSSTLHPHLVKLAGPRVRPSARHDVVRGVGGIEALNDLLVVLMAGKEQGGLGVFVGG